jgi:hypothetical protein
MFTSNLKHESLHAFVWNVIQLEAHMISGQRYFQIEDHCFQKQQPSGFPQVIQIC